MPPTDTQPPRIALAHDWLVGFRGGEAVLERIAAVSAELGSITALYTMFDERRSLAPRIDALRSGGRVRISTLTVLPRLRRWLLPAYPLAVRQLGRRIARDQAELGPIDFLISTSSAAVHGLRPPRDVPHLCYCHTPARYLWSQTGQYAGGLRGAALTALAPALRAIDRRASRNTSHFLANSSATAALIRSSFDRDAQVLHPPVRTDFFTPNTEPIESGEPATSISLPNEPFLLIAGALEPYKRTDLAIEVAKRTGRQLLIAGDGTELARLRSLASGAANIRFLGPATHGQLRTLYRAADALLYPQIEDFGITAVEAQACGTPVVAVGRGGALDTVVPGVTGSFAEDQTPDSFSSALAACPAKPLCVAPCRQNALRFAPDVFDDRLRRTIQAILAHRASGG